ncbi:MAG: response regulator [Deltaproteobacteria bacterium]|nr:response regulator [Deltaproteobacteria bacterium]
MKEFFFKFWAAPVFPNNEDKTRSAAILQVLFIHWLIGAIFIMAISATLERTDSAILVMGLNILAMLALQIPLRKGYVDQTSVLYLLLIWSAGTFVVFAGSGIRSAWLGIYITTAVTSAVLLSFRWAIVFSVMSVVVIFVVVWLEQSGYVFPRFFHSVPLGRGVFFSIQMYLALVPVYLMVKYLKKTLVIANEENVRRVRIQEALSQSELKFRNISEHIPGLVFQYNVPKEGAPYFQYLSAKGLSLFQFELDLANQPDRLAEIIVPEHRQRFEQSLRKAIEGQANWEFEGRYLSGRNRIGWLHGRATPVIAVDGLHYFGVLMETTEQYEMNERMLQSQKMEALGSLAGGVAHDFNNLLTPIYIYSDMLCAEFDKDTDVGAQVHEIRKASERAAVLTRRILAFSRRKVSDMAPHDLNDVVLDVKRMLERLIGETVEMATLTARKPIHVVCDQGQIEQILMNLVVNARDSMPSGGRIILDVSARRLDEGSSVFQGTTARPGPYAVLTIADNGCGMGEETKKQIFEPFFTTKEEGKGTGLGLATVKDIVLHHKGYIDVHSSPGTGTTFYIYLPIAVSTSIVPRLTSISDMTIQMNASILLVEDDEQLRHLLTKLLPSFGLAVEAVANPRDAIDILASGKTDFDLLLTDVVMPGMNGVQLFREMQDWVPDIKVLYMSGYTGDAFEKNNISMEGLPLIYKPFTASELNAMLNQVLEKIH